MNEGISRIIKEYPGVSRYITVYMYTMYDHDISESFNQSEISLMNLIFKSSCGTFLCGASRLGDL